MASSITLEVTLMRASNMRSFYADSLVEPNNEYISFQAKLDGVVVTVYKKVKNDKVKALFQGEKAEYEASIWGTPTASAEPKKQPTKKKPSKAFVDQIGSDEVGTGDFFGPITVAAAYVPKDKLARLQELGVTDSKKMEDSKILEIGPTLIHEFDYSQLALDNETYNDLVKRGMNLNEMKAKMHNRCLLNLKAKHREAKLCQDQFAEEKLYYSYLKLEPEIARPIEFSTKGELAFPSVALASCIARYSFLRKMKSLGEKYGVDIPFGAAAHVDEFARRFLEKHGPEELRKITKSNFANAKRLLK